MTSAFPTQLDFDKLAKMPDTDVAAIWKSLVETDWLSRCCQHHMSMVSPESPEWWEAVYCEMEVRGLPTEFIRPDEGANCPTCGSKYETRDDPKAFMHVYRVCPSCRTRRRVGDHLDCRLGQPEPLPEGW